MLKDPAECRRASTGFLNQDGATRENQPKQIHIFFIGLNPRKGYDQAKKIKTRSFIY